MITPVRLLLAGLLSLAAVAAEPADKPNLIYILADDLGWGDVGFNGNPFVETPALDRIAAEGVRMERFYAQAASCSPTRASAMTGRNGHRFGIPRANNGHLKPEERSLGEFLQDHGYTTGHFGKWHLGTLTETRLDANRGGKPHGVGHYAPPWDHGFDVSFVTESKVPTWDPMIRPVDAPKTYWAPRTDDADPADWTAYGTYYWTGPDQIATENLQGANSRVIMDRVIPFVEDAAARGQPFLAMVWFHTPHLPVVAGPEYTSRYPDLTPFEQHYYGSITAMDEQVGRLRDRLEALGEWENTILIFGSDNGPETIDHSDAQPAAGSAGPFRGRKRFILEGGVRVPGIVSWPRELAGLTSSALPFVTTDVLPSMVNLLAGRGVDAGVTPIDGTDALSLLRAGKTHRPDVIPYEFVEQLSLIDNEWKLYSDDLGETYQLYNVIEDPTETRDYALEQPLRVRAMRLHLDAWRQSTRRSLAGEDYR